MLFFAKLVPNPICVPYLKLLASTVAKIRRGSQFFSDTPLAQTPDNFGPKLSGVWARGVSEKIGTPYVVAVKTVCNSATPRPLLRATSPSIIARL